MNSNLEDLKANKCGPNTCVDQSSAQRRHQGKYCYNHPYFMEEKTRHEIRKLFTGRPKV